MALTKPGSLRRRSTSLFIALTFAVLAITGVLAFFRPFSITIIGLHSLMGFLFIAIAGLHLLNNLGPFKGHLGGPAPWVVLAVTTALTLLFLWQPAPVKSLLGLSKNLGPALDRFEIDGDRMVYQYHPAGHYRMRLTVRGGRAFDPANPPDFAIWLENQGAYHIQTLHAPEPAAAANLPYWQFKRRGWEKAKREAEQPQEIDLISSPTPNGSFDPADYILPADPETSTPYRLLIEINQAGDPHGPHADQPSLVHAVEIDELDPRTFQTLEIVGYPKREDNEGKEQWSLYYVDETFGSALGLIDSALLEIERGKP